MTATTRRGALRNALGLLAGAIGFGATGPASGAIASPDRTLRLRATELSAKVHGRTYGHLARPDDHISTHGQLVGRPGNGTIGTFAATSIVTRSPFNDHPTTIEHHIFTLPDGILIGSGQATGGVGTFAITGGTGRYADARGSYTAALSPRGLGGDGTASFDLTLTR